MKPPQTASDNLIDRTRHVWKARLGRDLSREDARRFAENVTGFFSLLAEWSRAEGPSQAAGKNAENSLVDTDRSECVVQKIAGSVEDADNDAGDKSEAD
jgi:hypothetical protein